MATNYISSLRLNNYVNQQATFGVELICAVFLDFQQRVLLQFITNLIILSLYPLLICSLKDNLQIHLSNSFLYLFYSSSSHPFLQTLKEPVNGKNFVGVILTVYFCCVSFKSLYMFILDTTVGLVLSTES